MAATRWFEGLLGWVGSKAWRVYALIALISGAIPRMFITRVRL